MYKFKEYTDEEFFGCKLRGVNNVVNAVIGGATDEGGHYANIPPSILENAARRGKAVHEAIEKFLKSGMDEPLQTDLEFDIYACMFEKWLNERTEIQEIIGVETKIISEELACKGVIDCIAKFRNKDEDEPFYALVDWKTSSNLDEFRTQCQLTLYYMLLREQYPDVADKIEQLRCLQITKYNYRWYRYPIDTKLGSSILYLYKNYLREQAEKREK